jgi:thiol reductant ABC exporter CydC subunit
MRMWSAMRADRRRLLLAGFLGFLASASAVALLGTSGWLISFAAEMPPVLALGVAAVLVRTFALTRSVFRYAERLVGHDAAFRGLTRLREDVYARLERLAPVGLTRFTRGDLLSRLVADVDTALDLPLRVVLPWAQAVAVSVGTVAFLLWLNPGAGVATAIALALGLTLVPWLVARLAARAEARLAPLRGEVSSTVVASLAGSSDLLAYGATGAALQRVRAVDDELTAVARRESASLGISAGLGIVLQGVAVVAALALAMPAVTSGQLEPVWLAVVALVPLAAYDLLTTLPASALALQRVRASAARVVEVIDSPLPVADPVDRLGPPVAPYAVAVRDLRARWSPDSPLTLRGIDLALAPGERIGIVGPSGAGKSTLAAVLLGFLSYDGSAMVGGREIREVDGDDLRTCVTLLTQDAHVFDTTIEANLRLGDAHADQDEMLRMLERVGLHSWLEQQPEALATQVGSGGVTMSGGERQRLALARLLLSHRPIMVFDEPTEHLDPATADALTDVLLEVTDGTSTVLITHRLRDLDRLDRIVVLISGEVVASGTHEDLLAEGGWYADRWRAETEQADLAALTASIPAGTAIRRSSR